MQPLTRKLALATALPLCAWATHAASLDDYKITLFVNGTVVKGTQEIGPLAEASTNRASVYNAHRPLQLLPGQSFQAVVRGTDPSGQTIDYTGSPRLKYETSCMTPSSLGWSRQRRRPGCVVPARSFPGC
jgi:hypothetical protein